MKNLEEVKNNANLSIKALFYLIEAQTGYKSKITNLDYTDLVFSSTPHDLDGYEYYVTVKFYSNVFKTDATFIKRTEMPSKLGKEAQIAENALPANALSYLNTTYPNYGFKKAFSAKDSAGAVKGYLVIIDANQTKYAVLFDATGTFVNAKIIR